MGKSQEWPARHVSDNGKPVPFHMGQNLAYDAEERFVVMSAGSQSGKAIDITTEIPTPDGFKNMGDLQIGDTIYAPDGSETRITYVSPIRSNHECYKIIFDDGNEVIADADHLWKIRNALSRKRIDVKSKKQYSLDFDNKQQVGVSGEYIVSTQHMVNDGVILFAKNNKTKDKSNYSIDLAKSIIGNSGSFLPIDPYVLGAWLGDGHSHCPIITSEDKEIIDRIINAGYDVKCLGHMNCGNANEYKIGKNIPNPGRGRINYFTKSLMELGVRDNKHIPVSYLRSDIKSRKLLLAGLLDTDGYCNKRGQAEFYSTNNKLFFDVVELACSLGYKVRTRSKIAKYYGKDCGLVYMATIASDEPLFILSRKANKHIIPIKPNTKRRYIVSIEKTESIPVKCITVDHPSGCYLITRAFIPTHNTSFGPWWLEKEIRQKGSGDYYAVTASYDLFKLKMLPSFLEVFEGLLNRGRFWSGDKVFELSDPITGQFMAKKSIDPMWGRVILRSASAPGGLESGTGKAAWCDEAGHPDFTVLAWRALERRLALNTGRVLFTTTLYNLGYLKRELIDVAKSGHFQQTKTRINNGDFLHTVNKEANINLIQFDSIVNPLFTQEEFERLRSTMPPDEFSLFYKGLETKLRTLIYDVFEESTHAIPRFDIPGNWPYVVGIDPMGEKIAALWIAINPETFQPYVVDEYYEPFGVTTIDHVHRILTQSGDRRVIAYVGGGPSERQARADFAGAGINLQEPPFSDVWSQIMRAYALFKSGGMKVFDDLGNLLAEIGSYQRKKDKAGNITEIIDHDEIYHLASCLRYASSWITEPPEVQQVEYNPVRIARY